MIYLSGAAWGQRGGRKVPQGRRETLDYNDGFKDIAVYA